jgi:hypothetical protein
MGAPIEPGMGQGSTKSALVQEKSRLGKMSEQNQEKGTLLTQTVIYVNGEEGQAKRWINFLAKITKGGKTFIVKDSNITREQWMEAFDILEARKGAIFENAYKGKKGGAGSTESTNAPF